MKKIIHKAFRINNKILRKTINLSDKFENKITTSSKKGTLITAPYTMGDAIDIQQFCNSFTYEIRPLNITKTNRNQSFVNFFIPTFDAAGVFGGIATATRIAAEVAKQKDMPLRVICIDRVGNLKYLNKFLVDLNCKEISANQLIDLSSRQDNKKQVIDFSSNDINIATAWWTAHLLNQAKLKKKYIYIIQDFEPIFYNLSDQYAYAEATYKTDNYIPICNTKLLYDFLLLNNYASIKRYKIYFEPAVDRELFKPSNEKNLKKKLFIYGRPTTQRNLMVHALKLVQTAMLNGILKPEEWDVFIAGDNASPSIQIAPGLVAQNLGKMELTQYANLAGKIDLAISLMLAPHPSYPPLELACSGAAVVTNMYKIKEDLSFYSKNLFTAELNDESLLSALKKASNLSRPVRLTNALSSAINEDWSEALEGSINKLLSYLT